MKVMVRPVRFLTVIAASLAIWLVMLTLNTAVVEAQGYDNRPSTENSLGLQVKSAILIDADTGQVLFQVNKDEPLPPASMTKLMTEYIVLKEIKDGRLKWDQIISVSPEAAETDREESQIFLAEGDQHTVRDLYIAMAVGSANDATRALATEIAGTEQAFVDKMNEMAKTLDLKSAVFTSATGYEPNTVISAADVAKLSYIILKDHPDFLEFSSMPEYKFRPRDEKPMINFNYMLGANKNSPGLGFLAYEGVDGMKTGFIEEAGYNFTGTVKRGDIRFISVVMDTSTINVRFQETAKLYNYAFSTFEKKTVLPPKSVVETIQSVKIKKGAKKSVNVVTDKDITFMVKKGVEPKVELVASQVKSEAELVAPIPAGTAVGTVTYKYTDAEQNITTEYTVNLVTTDEVAKAGWFKLMFRAIGEFFSGLFNGIIDMF